MTIRWSDAGPRPRDAAALRSAIRWVLCAALALLVLPAAAAPPQTINYQGFLTSATGTPTNGAQVMTFRLYDAATGGTLLWTELKPSVTVANGNFNVVLGTPTPITLPFDAPYWLTVTINADGEMSPRQPLTSSPYAFRASSLDSTATVAGLQIGGTITSATLPAGNLTGTLVTTQIANNAVTQEKLSPVSGAAAGKVLGTDGANLQWLTAGVGTVTSVGTGAGLIGGPITGSGTINLAATQLLPAGACAANQVAKWNGSAWICAADNDTNNSVNDARYFKKGGNAFGTTAGLGTTDDKEMQLFVNNAVALRLQPNAVSPNILAGSGGNYVAAGVAGASVSGGGQQGENCGSNANKACYNQVTSDFGTVGGGRGNLAGMFSTVAGGTDNTASGDYSAVAGGQGNTASGNYSTVAGGEVNTANGVLSTTGGGVANIASGNASTVGGGYANRAIGNNSTVGGGYGSRATADSSTVAGGMINYATGQDSTVAGGNNNLAFANSSTVGGGYSNSASGNGSTVSGGQNNYASGVLSTVAGGYLNEVNSTFSFAAGHRAKAYRPGMFVWSDSRDVNFDMTLWRGAITNNDNTFNVRATGGVYFATGIFATGQPSWACYTYNGGGWTCTSDRNVKRNFRPIDTQDALTRVSKLPVFRWQPLSGPNNEQDHIGPMAQDFYAAFGLGDSDKSIGLLDAAGVALAAIQGLNAKLEVMVGKKDAEIDAQGQRIRMLEEALASIHVRMGMK